MPSAKDNERDAPESEISATVVQPLNRFLRMAAMTGVLSAVQIHVDRGDDLDARDGDGMTPLMLSAARNRVAVCKLLLDAGASIALVNPSGLTAHDIAHAAGAHEAATLLQAAQTICLESSAGAAAAPVPLSQDLTSILSADVDAESETLGASETIDARQVEAQTMEDSSTSLELDEAFELDLSGWEADEEPPPPAIEVSVLQLATSTQNEISNHEAIDSSVEWDDLDIYLPGQALRPSRMDDDETRTRIRLLFLRAIREGSVPAMEVEDLATAAEQSAVPDAEQLLIRLVNDLGAEVDERFEYSTASEDFGVFVSAEETPLEEQAVDDAIAIVDSATSRHNEPLRMYRREFQPLSLLSAQEEVELGRAMEDALGASLDALATWPHGLKQVLIAGAEVRAGLRPMSSLSLGAVEADFEPAFSLDVDRAASSSEDEDDADLDGTNESSSLQLCDPTLAKSLSSLESLVAGSDHDSDIRDVLKSMRLDRDFLSKLACIENSANTEQGARFVHAIRTYQFARDRMTVSNLKLVFHLAKKYQHSGEPLDDLAQEGNIGLLKAVERYDWRRGFRFSTYATWWIRQQIGRYVADKCRTVRVPVHIYEKLQRIKRELSAFEEAANRTPNINEIASSTGLSSGTITSLLRLDHTPLPIHEIDVDKEIAADSKERLALWPPEDAAYMNEVRQSVDDLLETLTQKEQKTIRMRFGIGISDELTLEEVGQRYEVTRERVRQIEAKALRRLRHPSRGGVFARKGLGITYPAATNNPVATEEDDEVAAEPIENIGRRSDDAPKAISGSRRSPVTGSARLGQLLARAAELGIVIDDDREGESGEIWVRLLATPDQAKKQLARNLLAFGFKAWPGKGFWL